MQEETTPKGQPDSQAPREPKPGDMSRSSAPESLQRSRNEQLPKNNELIPVFDNSDGNTNLIHYLETQQLKYTQRVNQSQSGKDKAILQELIKSTQIQIDKLRTNPENDVSNFGISLLKEMESSSVRTTRLKKIYDFYSKIFYTKGLKTDFGRIQDESHSMTEGKFIIFCRQFNILDEKVHHPVQPKQQSVSVILNDSVRTHKWWQKNQYLQKFKITPDFKQFSFKEIHSIFKGISKSQTHIDFERFLELLNYLKTSMCFNEIQFDEFLGINGLLYKGKLKALSIPFSTKDDQQTNNLEVPLSIMTQDNQNQIKKDLIKKWHLEQRSRFSQEQTQREVSSRSQSTLQLSSQRPLNYTELKGRKSQLLFNPKELIDEQDDDDDQQYIASYIKSNKTEQVQKSQHLKSGSKTTGRRRTNNSDNKLPLKLPSLQK